MVSFKFKLVLLGAAAVGKTSLMIRFVNDEFKTDYAATIGAKFLSKEIQIDRGDGSKELAQLTLWDIAGQPRFEDLRSTFYRGASGALLIFDVTRKNTFDELTTWIREFTNVLPADTPIILIGNKSDLDGREVTPNEAKNFAHSKNTIYIETSAKTGINVEKGFFELTRILVAKSKGIELKMKPIEMEQKLSILIKSKIRDYIKSKGLNTSSTLIDGNELNTLILNLLDKAIERAKSNGRKTVQEKDL